MHWSIWALVILFTKFFKKIFSTWAPNGHFLTKIRFQPIAETLDISGADGGIRTRDLRITSA